MDWKNIGERAFWTFVEGFIVALPATLGLGMEGAGWKTAILSACMAGVSAVKTMVMDYIQQLKTKET